MLTVMLNQHPEILSTSEEPFVLYFYPKYKYKTRWTEQEIDQFLEEFWLLSEKSLDIYFDTRQNFRRVLLAHKDQCNFGQLCQLTYTHFLPPKDKTPVTVIIDKQIKYIYHLRRVMQLMPDAKFVVLVRDYRDVIAAWQRRKLGQSQTTAFLAKVWQIAYSQVLPFLTRQDPRFMLVRYEDLVRQPQETLIRICSFVGKTFCPEMLDFHHSAAIFFHDAQTQHSDPVFVEKLRRFHSNMLEPLSTDHIGKGGKSLNQQDLAIANHICQPLARHLGYLPYNDDVQTSLTDNKVLLSGKVLSFRDRLRVFRAWFSRKVYLRGYVEAPFWLKVWIKKYRPNKIEP